jgi:hypothetical protein
VLNNLDGCDKVKRSRPKLRSKVAPIKVNGYMGQIGRKAISGPVDRQYLASKSVEA